MMGTSNTQAAMFHYTSVDQLVPADDPLRAIEAVIDWEVIRERMARFYSPLGRPSIPPEQLLKAMLIGYLFGINGLHLAQATTGRAGAMWAIKAKGVWRYFRQADPTRNTGRVFREQYLIAPNDRHQYDTTAELQRRFQRVRHPLAE